MEEDQTILTLTTCIKVLQSLICQYQSQEDPDDREEIQNRIKQTIELNKERIKPARASPSKKYTSLKAHYDELIKGFEEISKTSLHDDDDEFDEPTQKAKEDIAMNLQVINFDPDEEKKEELEILRGVKAIKQATIGLVNTANENIAEQEYYIDQIQACSESTEVRTEQAMKELKKAAKSSRGTKLSIVKWASAAIGWVVGGPVVGIATGVGMHAAQKGVTKLHDKRMEKIANA